MNPVGVTFWWIGSENACSKNGKTLLVILNVVPAKLKLPPGRLCY